MIIYVVTQGQYEPQVVCAFSSEKKADDYIEKKVKEDVDDLFIFNDGEDYTGVEKTPEYVYSLEEHRNEWMIEPRELDKEL